MTELGDASGAALVHHLGKSGQTRKVSIVAVGNATGPGHPVG